MIKNYYIAKVTVRQCMADIRINDVPIFRKNVDGDLTTELPINHHIEFSGVQELSIKLHPLLGRETFLSGEMCSIEIWRYDGRSHTIIPIEEVCSSTLTVDENKKLLPFLYEKKAFASIVSYTINRWNDCVEIKDSRRITSEISALYKTIGQLLSDGQESQYMQYVRDREVNICSALLLGEDEVKLRNKMLFECLNRGFVLQPLEGRKRLQFYANNRVVSILDQNYGPLLRFVNEDTDEVLSIELLVGTKKGRRGLSIV